MSLVNKFTMLIREEGIHKIISQPLFLATRISISQMDTDNTKNKNQNILVLN